MLLFENNNQLTIANLLLVQDKIDFLGKFKDDFENYEKFSVLSKIVEIYDDYKILALNSEENKINLLVESLADELKNNHNLLLELLKSIDDALLELSSHKNNIKKEIIDLLSLEVQSSDLAIKVDNYLDDYRLVLNELDQKKFFDDDISPRRFAKIKRIYEKIFSMIDEPVKIIFFGPNNLSLYNKYSVIDLLVDEMRILRELVYKITEKVELILTTAEKEKEIEEKTEEKKSIELQEVIQERVESIEGGIVQGEIVQKEAREVDLGKEITIQEGVIQEEFVKEEVIQERVESIEGEIVQRETEKEEAREVDLGKEIAIQEGVIQEEFVKEEVIQERVESIEGGIVQGEIVQKEAREVDLEKEITIQEGVIQEEFTKEEFIEERVGSIEGGVAQVETVQEEGRQGESIGVIHIKDVEQEIVQKEETIPPLDFKETIDFRGADAIGHLPDFANFPDTIVEPVDQNQKVMNILDISDLLSEFEKVEIDQDISTFDSEIVFDVGESRIEKVEIGDVFFESTEQINISDTDILNVEVQEKLDLQRSIDVQENVISVQEDVIPVQENVISDFKELKFGKSEQSEFLNLSVTENNISDVLERLDFKEETYNQYETEEMKEEIKEEIGVKDIASSIELNITADQETIRVSGIDELAAILEEHQKKLETPVSLDFGDIDLSNIDLSNIDFSDIDLSNVELDLSISDLSIDIGESKDLVDTDKEVSISQDISNLKEDNITFVYNKEMDFKIQEVLRIFTNQDIQKIIYFRNNEYSYYSKDNVIDNNELFLLKNLENISFSSLYFERRKSFGFLLKNNKEMLLIIFGEGVQVGLVKLKIKNITLGG